MKLIDIDNQTGLILTAREIRKLRAGCAEGSIRDECGDRINDFDEFLDIAGNFCCDEATYLDAVEHIK